MNLVGYTLKGIYPILDAHWLRRHGPFSLWDRGKMVAFASYVHHASISTVQLRCKDSGKESYRFMHRWYEWLRRECPNLAIVINDRVDIALALGADGVHVGQDDLPVDVCRALLGPDKIIGLSTHSLDEITQAVNTSANYIGFGPVYPTASKTDSRPVQGMDALTLACQASRLPVVAIGGINHTEKLIAVARAGAAAAAMISGLWDSEGRLLLSQSEKAFAHGLEQRFQA